MHDVRHRRARAPARGDAPLATVVQRAVGGGALLVVLGILVAPRMSTFRYSAPTAALALAAAVALALVAARLVRRRLEIAPRHWDIAAGVLCVLLTAVAAVFAYAGAYKTTWDPQIVEMTAAHPSSAVAVLYFSVYPNMEPLYVVARAVRSVTGGTGIDYAGAFAALNTVSLLATAVLLYVTVRRLAGPARGVLALLAMTALLGTSSWLSVPYTDMLAEWTPIAAIALVAPALRGGGTTGTVVRSAAAGVVLAIGYVLKVTPVIGLVALVATLAVTATGHRRVRGRLAQVGISAVLAFAATVPALDAGIRSADHLPPLQSEWAATPLTYMAEGFRVQRSIQQGPLLYGAFDRTIVDRTRRKDTAAQNAIAWRFIRQEWHRRGLLGTVRFEAHKMLFNWGDGTFWARGEGHDAIAPPLRHGPLVSAVLSWNAPSGRLFRLQVLFLQVTWTAVLLALGVGLVRSRFRPELLLMALTVVGIAAFTLLFQGRSRYVLVHVPVVIALAACVVPLPPRTRRLELTRTDPPALAPVPHVVDSTERTALGTESSA